MAGDDLGLASAVESFDVDGDCLVVGGRPLTEIAAQAGEAPFYLYSRELIDRRVSRLRDAIPAAVEIHYAMKANPMPAVVAHIAPRLDGLDVASAGELRVALEVGAEPAHISFAGPGKSLADLEAAVAAGVVLNVESETELARLVDIGERTGRRPRVAVRVNPDFELKASGMKMAGGAKQFGIDAERVPQVLRDVGRHDLEFDGFHIFSGSQNLRHDAIIEAQQKSVALALELTAAAPAEPRLFNIGGGFGIPYFPGDKPLELGPIGENLEELVETARSGAGARLAIELGRYIIGEAGLYVCRVVDRKESRGQIFLITDGGLHHHLAASGNFGQVIRRNYPVLIGNRVRGKQREKVSVVGPLCTPLDLLADRMEMAQAGIGDLVVVFQSGAYGYTASPHLFLSHPAPRELLV